MTNTTLLTTREVAEILRVSRRQVRLLAADGAIACVKLGTRTHRYTTASVEALIHPSTGRGIAPHDASTKLGDGAAEHAWAE